MKKDAIATSNERRGAGPVGGAQAVDCSCRPQEAWCADSPLAIQDAKRYLLEFDRLQKTATSDEQLFNKMTELYPHWIANQSWLMFGFPGG
jgi:hypothetical protein